MPHEGRAGSPRVAFVGLLGGDDEGGRNAAYSAAGTLFQERLIGALRGAGVDVDHVFALRPMSSFPRARALWLREVRGQTIAGTPATLIPFINFGPVKALSAAIALVPRLVRWARASAGGDRVILFYNIQNPPGIAGVVAARLARVKVVAVVADVQIPGSGLVDASWMRRVEFALQRTTLPRLDGLVTLTARIAADFAPAAAHIVMEGAAPAPERAGDPTDGRAVAERAADAGVRVAPFTLMYAGGLNELKGIPLLLAAFASLPGRHYRLWITGAGPLRGEVQRAAAHDPRIEYLGFPPYAEVLARYRRASLLVNPHSAHHASARYLFPSKLIEYLATGTPVVSTVSTPEVASEYGHVLIAADADTPDALAAAIRTAESMPVAERAALGARAREYVTTRKSWATQAARVAAFLREVSAGSARPLPRHVAPYAPGATAARGSEGGA